MDIAERFEKLVEDVTQLRVAVGVNTEKLAGIVEKIDEVSNGINDIRDSLVGKDQAALKTWKDSAIKVAISIGCSSGVIALFANFLS